MGRTRVGWVLGTYLKNDPPRAVALETELVELRAKLQNALDEVDRLRGETEALGDARSPPRPADPAESERSAADPGWPYLIAGAMILGFGLLWGMLLQWLLARRSSRSRLRL